MNKNIFTVAFLILLLCNCKNYEFNQTVKKKRLKTLTFLCNSILALCNSKYLKNSDSYKPHHSQVYQKIINPFENVNIDSPEQNLKESVWTNKFFELNKGNKEAYNILFGKEYHRSSLDDLSPDRVKFYKAYPHCWALYKNNIELTKNILDNYPEVYRKYTCDDIEKCTLEIASRMTDDIKRKLGEENLPTNNFLELTELFLKNGKVKYDMNKLICFHGTAGNEEMVNLLFKYVKEDELREWTKINPREYTDPLWQMSWSHKINNLSILKTFYKKGFRPDYYFIEAAESGNLRFFEFFYENYPKIDIRNGYDGIKYFNEEDPLVGAIRCLRYHQEGNSTVNCIDIAKLILERSKKPICESIIDYAKEKLLDYNEIVDLFEVHNNILKYKYKVLHLINAKKEILDYKDMMDLFEIHNNILKFIISNIRSHLIHRIYQIFN